MDVRILGKIKRLHWNEFDFFLCLFASLMPNRLFMSLSEVSHLPLIQFIFVVSSYASCVCRRMHCLLDAPLLLSFFLLLLGFLIVQWTQSFFILWTVTLLKHLFKIISVWLCHHSFTKYFYTMANYTISAFGFNLQHFMLITAFFIYNYPKILFSYRKKK